MLFMWASAVQSVQRITIIGIVLQQFLCKANNEVHVYMNLSKQLGRGVLVPGGLMRSMSYLIVRS